MSAFVEAAEGARRIDRDAKAQRDCNRGDHCATDRLEEQDRCDALVDAFPPLPAGSALTERECTLPSDSGMYHSSRLADTAIA